MGPAAAGAGSRDILNGSVWECWWNEPDDDVDSADASQNDRSWMPATVPGTAASALRDLGQWTWGDDDQGVLDGSDWWYRCRFDVPGEQNITAFPVDRGILHPARFTGSIDGRTMTLTVTLTDTAVTLGPVSLTFEKEPNMGPCPICFGKGARGRRGRLTRL